MLSKGGSAYNKANLSRSIRQRVIEQVNTSLNAMINLGEKINKEYVDGSFALGVENFHNGVVTTALKLGVDIETLVCEKPPLIYLCTVSAENISKAIPLIKTLLNNGASLSKCYTIKTDQGEKEMNALECAALSPDEDELMLYFLKRYQQTHPDLQVGEEARQHEGAAAGIVSSNPAGDPHIEDNPRELAGEDYTQGHAQD